MSSKKRTAAALTGPLDAMAVSYLDDLADPQLCVSPLVWEPGSGSDGKDWYFTICGLSTSTAFFIDKICVEDDALREQFIFALIQQSIALKKGFSMHRFDDELDMARFSEAAWPSDRITKLRKGIELERATAAGKA